MKPPPTDDVDPGATAGPLNELSLAVRSGRLVRLLKGKGLNRSTVEELLRPESLTVLRKILTDHLLSGSGRGTREDGRNPVDKSGHGPADGSDHRRAALQEGQEREDDRAAASSRLFRTEER